MAGLHAREQGQSVAGGGSAARCLLEAHVHDGNYPLGQNGATGEVECPQ